MAAKTHAIQ